MSDTTFLPSEPLWQMLPERVRAARHVDAAIAYFGTGGAQLLPLRHGHRLVVDMSLPTVKGGGTDPHEIAKLIRRGVQAFTRRNLHAKVVVADNWVLAGSANTSRHSRNVLDEAALATTERAAVRRAREFIDQMCIEPIRPEYLEQCRQLYRPPKWGSPGHGKTAPPRAKHTKLWMVSLSESPIPASEQARYAKGEARAEKRLRNPAVSLMDDFHWPTMPKMANELEFGDWILMVSTQEDGDIVVHAPGQLLFIDNYIRDRGSERRRWVFHVEVPRRGESMPWRQFQRKTRSVAGFGNLTSPRTIPIRNTQAADHVLGLWTASGRVSRR